MSSIISVKNITKQYGKLKALDNFSLTVEKGDICGLMGPNGAGKSTLIKIITGLTLQNDGTIKLFGSNNLEAERKKIGSVVEMPAFFGSLTAKENLIYYSKQFNCDITRVNECLLRVGLFGARDKKFKSLSLGMKQRLAIALSLIRDAQLIILDEPTNGLDPIGISELRETIKDLNKNGMTFIICSHILPELSQIANKFVVIDKGRFVKEFTKEDLLSATSDKVILSSSEFDKLIKYLKEKQLSFVEIEHNTVEVDNNKFQPNSFAKDMVDREIVIDAIFHKKASLEDVFVKTLNESGRFFDE